MGTIILMIAFVMEAAFATYCIITKSNQKQVRSFVRIGALAAFVILTLVSVIEWSLRWYGLAALLLVWAALGAWTLIHTALPNKEARKEKEYKTRRIVVKAVTMLLLVTVALIPPLVFPHYELIKTTGEHKVATVLYTYTDKNRVETYTNTGEKRKLNVEFWYPKDYDKAALHTYPLVIFSPGGFGVRSSNESLFNELASHGYVVGSIDHTYQSLYTTDVYGNTILINSGYMNEVNAENARANRQQSYELYQKWMGIRTGDINFVIDHILAEAKNNDADIVYKLVDRAKIGVMGHSLGGSTALGIGRIRHDISAVIALESPFMYDIQGVKDGEFVFSDKVYPVPVLNVYSDSSWSHLSQWPQYAENYALLSKTAATAFNVHIRGVGHFTLTDLALTSPFLTRVFNGQSSATDTVYALRTINKVALDFFDSYLKSRGPFTSAGTY